MTSWLKEVLEFKWLEHSFMYLISPHSTVLPFTEHVYSQENEFVQPKQNNEWACKLWVLFWFWDINTKESHICRSYTKISYLIVNNHVSDHLRSMFESYLKTYNHLYSWLSRLQINILTMLERSSNLESPCLKR